MSKKRLVDTKKGMLRQALLWQLERFVPWEALEDLLWGDDKDGGPYNTRGNIHIHIMRLRDEGYNIEVWNKVGVRMRETPLNRKKYHFGNPRGRYGKSH